jgi:hypothetical protein
MGGGWQNWVCGGGVGEWVGDGQGRWPLSWAEVHGSQVGWAVVTPLAIHTNQRPWSPPLLPLSGLGQDGVQRSSEAS